MTQQWMIECQCVRACVLHEMYDYVLRTNGCPRSANFWTCMQVDKLPSSANFHQNRQRFSPSFDQIFESSTLGMSDVIISQTLTDRTNVAIAKSRMWVFGWYINIWPWPILKVSVKVKRISTIIYRRRWQIGRTLLLPTYRKSNVAFRLAYLHLILANSKDQGQVHAYFNWKYLANGDI